MDMNMDGRLAFKRRAFFILIPIALMPVILFFIICYQVDIKEKNRTLKVIEAGLNAAIVNYGKVIKDYAVWDQMYTNTVPVLNEKWAWTEGNLGSSLYKEYSINGIFLLDKNLNTIYSVKNGQKTQSTMTSFVKNLSSDNIFRQGCGKKNSLVMIKGVINDRPGVIYCHKVISPLNQQSKLENSTTLVFVKILDADEIISLGKFVAVNNLQMKKSTNLSPSETITFGSVTFDAKWDFLNSGLHIFYNTLPFIIILYTLMISGCYVFFSRLKKKDKALSEKDELISNNQLALYLTEKKIKEITELAVILFAQLENDLSFVKIEANVSYQDCQLWYKKCIFEKIKNDQVCLRDWMMNINTNQPRTLSRCYFTDNNNEKIYVNLTAKKNEEGQNSQYSIVLTDISTFIKDEIERSNDLLNALSEKELLEKLHSAILHNIADNYQTVVISLSVRNLAFISTVYGDSFTTNILKRIKNKIKDVCSTHDFVAKLESGNILFCHKIDPAQASYDEAWKTYIKNIINNIQLSLRNNTESITPVICAGCLMIDNKNKDVVTALKFLEIAHNESRETRSDNIIFSNSENIKKHEDRLKMMTLITEAIEKDSFSLVYQPKYNFSMMSLSGVEALIRWSHQEYGFISPAQFIPVAEKSDLIFRITAWVIKSVFALSSEMQTITFSINLSGRDFENPDLFNQIESYLNLFDTNPNNIIFEITEGVIINNPDLVRKILLQMKERGFKIHIDDFGTGYSSLGYLRDFPFDAIKLDRSFIKDIEHNEQDTRIVNSIINLGKAFDLQVIAEGVENIKQFSILQIMECDEVQGYYYSRPLDRESLIHFLSNQ
ncbi:EAL domain-containing protein [Enterobacter soli]|uniref:EAL domain-containing protein n=1 Tax=Enterobacter soli TaxID=885040 RepID=UPI0037323E5E